MQESSSKGSFLDFLVLEHGTERLSRNVNKEVISQKSADVICFAAEA